jgi:cysteine-rich repeat protein
MDSKLHHQRVVSTGTILTGLALGVALIASCSSNRSDGPASGSSGSAAATTAGRSGAGTNSAGGAGASAQGGDGGDAQGGENESAGTSSAGSAGMNDIGGSAGSGVSGGGAGGVSGSAGSGVSGGGAGGVSGGAGSNVSGSGAGGVSGSGVSGGGAGGVSGGAAGNAGSSGGGGGSNSVSVCGNGTLESGEQCDDGGLTDLDGCDAVCRYEVIDRLTSLGLQGSTAPAFCTPTTNRLGAQAFTSTFLSALGTQIQTAIAQASINVMLRLSDLDDLSGATDPDGLSVGFFTAVLDPAKGAWPAAGTQDFWFRARASELDGNGLPSNLLSAGLSARVLSAGPGQVHLPFSASGSLALRGARVSASLNDTPAPDAPPAPPQLATGLRVFQTLTASGTGQGLCGNVTVDSLAQIPVPAELTGAGATACGACTGSRAYTACTGSAVDANCNSLLDVLVGGCKAVSCLITVVNPQQPDVAGTDNDVDVLTLGTKNKCPTAQTTGNDDAYSSYFKFNANRARVTGKY